MNSEASVARLAIVISCYNYESYVGDAIESVLSQGRDDVELVVVDDGSKDRSWDVISRYPVTSYRLENGGARNACLYGLDRTHAPFVLFLDADDRLKPGSLDILLGQLDPNLAKIQFGLSIIDSDGRLTGHSLSTLESYRRGESLAAEVLARGVYKSPPTSGNIFRRDICDLLREADYDTWVDGVTLFAAPFFGDVLSLSDEHGCYRVHGKNDSGLGRAPDVAALDRELARYVARLDHLREILRRSRPELRLVDPRRTYFYLERSLWRELASGRRPGLGLAWSAMMKLRTEDIAWKNKIALAGFFAVSAMLPAQRGRTLLAYRWKSGSRSPLGFLKSLLGNR